jgi:hypothetical protein
VAIDRREELTGLLPAHATMVSRAPTIQAINESTSADGIVRSRVSTAAIRWDRRDCVRDQDGSCSRTVADTGCSAASSPSIDPFGLSREPPNT